MSYKRWVFHLSIASLFISLLIILVNLIVDPYRMYGIIDIKGFNRVKNHAQSDRMTKFYCIKRYKPVNVMFGTSTIDVLNPGELNRYIPGRVYSLGLAGSNIYEQYRYFQFVTSNYKIKNVLFGIELFSFNPERKPQIGFEEKRLDNSLYVKDFLDSLISLDTLNNSFQTVRDNVSGAPPDVDYVTGMSTRIKFYDELKEKGVLCVKERIPDGLQNFANDKTWLNSEEFKNPNSVLQTLGYLRTIAGVCRSNNINLKIFICPTPSYYFDLIYKMGLGNTFETLKREIAKITDFYDFTGCNSITSNLDCFWDSLHIRAEASRLIFARLYDDKYDDKSVAVPSDFGKLVTKSNVEKHLLVLRKQVNDINLTAIKNGTFSIR